MKAPHFISPIAMTACAYFFYAFSDAFTLTLRAESIAAI